MTQHTIRAPYFRSDDVKLGLVSRTIPLRVVVPNVIDRTKKRYIYEFKSNIGSDPDAWDPEYHRKSELDKLRKFVMKSFQESRVFESVDSNIGSPDVDATVSIEVLEFDEEDSSRYDSGLKRDYWNLNIAFRIVVAGTKTDWKREFQLSRHGKLGARIERTPNELDAIDSEETEHATEIVASLFKELVATISNDQELIDLSNKTYEMRLASRGDVFLPTIRFSKPSHTEIKDSQCEIECTVDAKSSFKSVEVRFNSHLLAAAQKDDSKGVGVSQNPASDSNVSITWNDHGAKALGTVALEPGRNLIEIVATLATGQSTMESLLVTRLGAGTTTRKPVGQRWAVLVGVDNYKNAGRGVSNLRFASKDAREMYDFLRSPKGGAFPLSNVRLLINEQATFAAVRDAMFEFLAQAQDDDLVVLFLSCHGAPQPGRPDNLYLVTHDTDPEKMASTAVPMWDVETALKRQIRAERVIVLADSCHSAGVGGVPGAKEGESNLINKYVQQLGETKPGRAIFTASEANELSFEGEEYGGGHGAFTHFLLEGLNGAADDDTNGTVTLGEAVEYTREKVRRATKSKQHPTPAGKFDRDLPMSS